MPKTARCKLHPVSVCCRIKNMIRRAQESDLDQIYFLYRQYVLDVNKINDSSYVSKVEKEGFTIETSDKEDLLNRIKNDVIFNVFEQDGQIVGYIDFNKEVYFPEEAENIIWLDQKTKEEYFQEERSIVLHYIAVDLKHTKRGIARELLQKSEEELRSKAYRYLFAIITTGPVKNYPSIRFHEKMGFTRVCKTLPIELFGIKNYESELYKKGILDIFKKGPIL